MIFKLIIISAFINKYKELLMSWCKELVQLSTSLFKRIDLEEPSLLIKMEHFPFDGFAYMSWCGNIIYKKDRYSTIKDRDLWHETIHKLLAGMRFKRWYRYYLSYLGLWIKCGFKYRNIPYEKEAYANQDNSNYIVTKDSYKLYK